MAVVVRYERQYFGSEDWIASIFELEIFGNGLRLDEIEIGKARIGNRVIYRSELSIKLEF